MMRFCNILLLLSGFLVSVGGIGASDPCVGRRSVRAEGKDVPLCYVERTDSWVTPACVGDSSCGALGLLEDASKGGPRLPNEELGGGKNPSNLLCSKLRGQVVFATLPSRSQLTLCEAKDKSLVDCDSLYRRYLKK